MPIIGQVEAYVQGRQDAEDDRPVGAERMPTAVISAYWQGFSIRRAEMREEDDDLLRAAEELGIDLSGVRATDGQAADESEALEINEGEEGQTSDDAATDAGYIEAAATDGEETE